MVVKKIIMKNKDTNEELIIYKGSCELCDFHKFSLYKKQAENYLLEHKRKHFKIEK